ncbi:MAG TPA: YfiR family protein [Blastocatellia bacterium]|nr:YfiR family protein [Blastocatellia bacterium]
MIAACLLPDGISPTRGQTRSANEYEIKAAYLYNFAKFIDWPAEVFPYANAPIVIGVVGDDPFGHVLDQVINGKTVNGRPLTVRRLAAGQDLRACHILFISSSEESRAAQIVGSLQGASVLTVGDMSRFIHLGGMIRFALTGNNVRFEIHVGRAERARLRLSSRLLSVAKVLRG